jgi:hypothetical protein
MYDYGYGMNKDKVDVNKSYLDLDSALDEIESSHEEATCFCT